MNVWNASQLFHFVLHVELTVLQLQLSTATLVTMVCFLQKITKIVLTLFITVKR